MEHSRLDLEDLRAFFLVAETGSFARAAQRLDSSKSIVSRRVASLERVLAAQLLQRTARGTHLTEVGQTYYDQAKVAVAQLEFAAESVSEAITDISGPIRVTGPVFFGANYLAAALGDFARHYPRIELEINFSDETIDIVNEGYDVAVRLGHLPDSNLASRRLCQSRRVVVASPDYLASPPPVMRPEDLTQHRMLHYNGINTQDLYRYRVDGQDHSFRITPHLRSNSAAMLMQGVKSGLGLTLLPLFVTGAAIQSGEAEQVLKDYDWGMTPVTLLLPQGRNATRRVRALVDFLVLSFANRIL